MTPGMVVGPAWWLPLNILTVVLLAGLIVFIHQRRPPASLMNPMRLMATSALIWVVGDIACLYAPDAATKQVAINFLYLGSLFLLPFWWLLTLRFCELCGVAPTWVRPWMKTAPFVVASVFWLLALTNSWHGQFITPVAGGRNIHFWMFKACAAVVAFESALLVFMNAVMCLRTNHSTMVRRTAATMLAGAILALSAIVAQTVFAPAWPIDLPMLSCSVTVALCVLGIYRFQLFHLFPVTLREVFENDPEGVVLIDSKGRLRFSNRPARRLLPTFPFTPDAELLTHLAPLLSRTDGDDSPVTPSAFWREVIDGPSSGKLYYDTSSPRRCLHFAASEIVSRWSGRTSHCLRILDATALIDLERQHRELSAEVQRSERLRSLGVLAGGIAHEINNPIGSISIAAEYALRFQDEEDVVQQALETVLAEADRCGQIVGGILRFARDESSRRLLASVNDCVLQVRDHAMSWSGENRIDLSLDLDGSIRPIPLNPTEIEQVLTNLIRNAVQAGGPNTRVAIETRSTATGVRMTVRDDGPGMSPEALNRALEPFYTGRADGTGLGLSVVHGIVSTHGGKLSIENGAIGGTIATIDLPAGAIGTRSAAGRG